MRCHQEKGAISDAGWWFVAYDGHMTTHEVSTPSSFFGFGLLPSLTPFITWSSSLAFYEYSYQSSLVQNEIDG